MSYEAVKKPSPRGAKNCSTVVQKSSEGGAKNFRDNIKAINIKAAADQESEKNLLEETATADSFGENDQKPEVSTPPSNDIPDLKQRLKLLNSKLIFDEKFYRIASDFMAAYNLDTGYVSWIYEFCTKRKPNSISGYFFKVFLEPRYVELYRERQTSIPPNKMIRCPVCGAVHDSQDSSCPNCHLGIAFLNDKEEIERQRRFFALSPSQRKSYETELEELLKGCELKDYFKKAEEVKAVKRKYGL